ncbi:MAG: helix-turn-helix transcriptional regulator [Dehalococcoidia bacterium]
MARYVMGMLTRQPTPGNFEWCAESIKALRNHLGQSQSALARELGIRQQTISEWETGMYRPRGASITILTLLAMDSAFPFESASGNGTRNGHDEDKRQAEASRQSRERNGAETGVISTMNGNGRTTAGSHHVSPVAGRASRSFNAKHF